MIFQPKPFINILIFSCLFFTACRQTDHNFTVKDVPAEYLKLDNSYLEVSTVAEGLSVPWGMDYIDNKILFTEIAGKVKELNLTTGEVRTLLEIEDVFTRTTPGLLDITIQKNTKDDPYVFLNYTKKRDSLVVSTLMRYQYNGSELINPTEILSVAGANGHNGTRLLIDKNNILYWATGDVADNNMAQDSTTLNGKVLRMNLDGSVPADNPIPNSLVYAWGFRNIQGMTLDKEGNLFTAEHGDAIEDEVNWVRPLHNYGWPLIEGKHDTDKELAITAKTKMTEPIRSWTPVIAPAGMAYYNHDEISEWKNSLLLVTLKSQTLRVLNLNEDQHSIKEEHIYFGKHFGRMRAVLVLPNGDVLLSTSNRDWNPQPGFPKENDDRIIRLRITDQKPQSFLQEDPKVTAPPSNQNAAVLYKNYCASCHKEDGKGVANSFPPLVNSARINDLTAFTKLLLEGTKDKKPINGVSYEQNMASYSFLKDDELAAIINYVKTEFGDKKTTTPEAIKAFRIK